MLRTVLFYVQVGLNETKRMNKLLSGQFFRLSAIDKFKNENLCNIFNCIPTF